MKRNRNRILIDKKKQLDAIKPYMRGNGSIKIDHTIYKQN
jgi:hypothetical protein